jgi:hypothetical protein
MLLVTSVVGPSHVVAGQEAVYRVASFNKSNPTPEERQKINWIVMSKDQEIARFDSIGEELRFQAPSFLVGKWIRVMAFVKNHGPIVFVSIVSVIVSEDCQTGFYEGATLLY